jgi:hypothetical protein
MSWFAVSMARNDMEFMPIRAKEKVRIKSRKGYRRTFKPAHHRPAIRSMNARCLILLALKFLGEKY